MRRTPSLSYQQLVTDAMFREGVRGLVGDRRECGSTQVESGVRGSPGRPDGMSCDEDNWPEAATKMSPGPTSDLRSAPHGRRRTSAEEGQPTDTRESTVDRLGLLPQVTLVFGEQVPNSPGIRLDVVRHDASSVLLRQLFPARGQQPVRPFGHTEWGTALHRPDVFLGHSTCTDLRRIPLPIQPFHCHEQRYCPGLRDVDAFPGETRSATSPLDHRGSVAPQAPVGVGLGVSDRDCACAFHSGDVPGSGKDHGENTQVTSGLSVIVVVLAQNLLPGGERGLQEFLGTRRQVTEHLPDLGPDRDIPGRNIGRTCRCRPCRTVDPPLFGRTVRPRPVLHLGPAQ